MADISKIDKSAWQKFKKQADIPSSSWWKRADADVGKHIDAFQKARKQWKSAKGSGGTARVVEDYVTAIARLEKALANFLKAKEFKTEVAKKLQTDIGKWQSELSAKSQKLYKFYKRNESALKNADAEQLRDRLEGLGIA